MSPRLAPAQPPYPPAVAEDLARLMPPGMEPIGLFRTIAHNPRVLHRMRRGGLLDPGSVTVRDRELAILRTTARCGAEYEWGVHVAYFAAAIGLTAAQVEATVHGGADDVAWSERDAAVIALCDALHDTASVPEPLWARLGAIFDAAQTIELLTLAGQYHMISYLTNGLALALEPGAARFPPPRGRQAT
jgi:4-carboxymuconolactone decarboxylase